jgi:hypothetical protein
LLQAKGRRWRCYSGGGELAGRLAGSGQTGLPATKSQGKTTKLKRRPRGFHLRAQEEGEDAGEEDPGAGRTPAAALQWWCGGRVEKLREVV